MPTKEEIENLIKMLDGRMSEGSGHINVKVNENAHVVMDEINVVTKMDCDLGDTACKIPNLPMFDDDDF